MESLVKAVIGLVRTYKAQAVQVDRKAAYKLLLHKALEHRESADREAEMGGGMGHALGVHEGRVAARVLEGQALAVLQGTHWDKEQLPGGNEEDLVQGMELEQLITEHVPEAVRADRATIAHYLKEQARHFRDAAAKYREGDPDHLRCMATARELETQARRIKGGYHTPGGSEVPMQETEPAPATRTEPTFATLRETPELLHTAKSLNSVIDERRLAMERALSAMYLGSYQGDEHRITHTPEHAFWHRGYIAALIHVLELRRKRKAQAEYLNVEKAQERSRKARAVEKIAEVASALGASVTRVLDAVPSFPMDMTVLAACVKEVPETFGGAECWLRMSAGVMKKLELLGVDLSVRVGGQVTPREVAEVLLRRALLGFKPEKTQTRALDCPYCDGEENHTEDCEGEPGTGVRR